MSKGIRKILMLEWMIVVKERKRSTKPNHFSLNNEQQII